MLAVEIFIVRIKDPASILVDCVMSLAVVQTLGRYFCINSNKMKMQKCTNTCFDLIHDEIKPFFMNQTSSRFTNQKTVQKYFHHICLQQFVSLDSECQLLVQVMCALHSSFPMHTTTLSFPNAYKQFIVLLQQCLYQYKLALST